LRTVSASYLKTYYDVCVAQGAQKSDLLPFIPGGEQALNSQTSRFSVESVTNVLTKTEEKLQLEKTLGRTVSEMSVKR